MKRFVTLIFIFFLFYFGIQIAFKFTTGGYEIEYEINSDQIYAVKEIYTVNKKKEDDNYYIKILSGENEFTYQIYNDLGKVERIVKDVKSYKDETYSCIFPIFKKGYQLDVTCLSNGVQYYYQSIKGKDAGLDSFVSNLQEAYSSDLLQDHAEAVIYNSNVTFYQDNIVKEHSFAAETYKGAQLLNATFASSLYESNLFHKDIYNKKISAYVGKYYVVADYNSDYEFNQFYLVDMETLKKSTIEYHKSISLDSYVQGVVEDSLYVFDRSNKTQYEINVKTKTIVEVGNVDLKIKYYQNGEWSTVSAYDAVSQNLSFLDGDVTKEFSGYEKVDKVGHELSGYYYFYKKTGNGYAVYRSNVQEPSKLTYLFEMNQLSQVVYVGDYLYFKNGDTISYYNDATGIRKLYRNVEFNFNNNLMFGVSD